MLILSLILTGRQRQVLTSSILTSDSMELGYGNMDLKTMVDIVKENGVDAVVLESHKNWVDKSPIKSFQLSAKFMNENV